MSRRVRTAPIVAAVLLLVAVGGFVYLGSDSGGESGGTAPARPCDGLPDFAGPSSGATAVLLDRSRSTRGAGPDYATALTDDVREAVARGDTVSVGGFDGAAATVTWMTVATRFPGDDTARAFARAEAVRCLTDTLRGESTAPAQAPGTDVLGALGEAGSRVTDAPAGRRHIIVATDGLVNEGCADLLEIAIGGDANRIVDRCANDRSIPRLAGAAVTFVGLGKPAAGQPIPQDTQLSWLRTMWNALCAAATGSADSCQRREVNRFPASRDHPSGPPDTTVTFPVIQSHRLPGGFVLDLPDALLFETDSNDLMAGSSAAFESVASTIHDAEGRIIKVVGHTDSRGPSTYNGLLSQARAQTVATELRNRYHLVVRQVAGVGFSQPQCSPEYGPGHTPDESAMQCNRRVEVFVSVPGDNGR